MVLSFEKIDILVQIINERLTENGSLTIAIDGRCGAGKTTLAGILAQYIDCNLFMMDDFFLPFEMRTAERMATAGGNSHYERVYDEILLPIQKKSDVIYRKFNCKTGEIGEGICTKYKPINIIEGSYSCHPFLENQYDIRIFVDVDSQTQIERIEKRSGKENAQMFKQKWIPLEEKYFDEYSIREKCDYIIK